MILQVQKLKRLLFMKFIKICNKLNLIKPDSCYYMGGVNVLPPPLTVEEEKELLKKLEYDENVKTILIERNLRLVVYISRKFENTGIDMEDLISIGTIGLIKAVNTFNLDKNIKLATYASRCIENEILMCLRKNNKKKSEVSFDEPLNVDLDGNATYDIDYNPNGSFYAVEGITSLDGRILGKMGHSERIGKYTLKNIHGEKDQKIFESGVNYFK